MGWKLRINFDDGSSETCYEVFKTKAAAYEEYESWLDNWNEGRSVLMDAGEDYCDKNIEDCDIWKE